MRPAVVFGILLLALSAILVSCAPKFGTVERKVGWDQKGDASWYGEKFHGRTTASGEIYDMYKLTAAHRTLPFGTLVKITNLRNDQTVIVRINDRGPSIRSRIIDLSYASAQEVGMIQAGIVPVVIKVIEKP
jgi:rare lipoprotein A